MIDEDSLQKLEKRNAAILPQLDERQRRIFAAAEARAAGHGGIAAVSRVTLIAASTIGRGLHDRAWPEGTRCAAPLALQRLRELPGSGSDHPPACHLLSPAMLADPGRQDGDGALAGGRRGSFRTRTAPLPARPISSGTNPGGATWHAASLARRPRLP